MRGGIGTTALEAVVPMNLLTSATSLSTPLAFGSLRAPRPYGRFACRAPPCTRLRRAGASHGASVYSAPMNRLASETSAYLRQHMHNPVHWFAWGEEARAEAAARDVPMLVSIGYSACHWCHVMERESFEDPATAELMNQLFVNVKVDREERPDVDRIYMDFLIRTVGHGGWPLTAFCTPEGRPFYAGTYFPPERRHGLPAFRELLEAIAEAWRTRRDELERNAAEAVAVLARRPSGVASGPPGATSLVRAAGQLLASADT